MRLFVFTIIFIFFAQERMQAAPFDICSGTRDESALFCFVLVGGVMFHAGLNYGAVILSSKLDDELSGEYRMRALPATIFSSVFSALAGGAALFADGLEKPNGRRFAWAYPSAIVVGGLLGYYITRRLKPLTMGLVPEQDGIRLVAGARFRL